MARIFNDMDDLKTKVNQILNKIQNIENKINNEMISEKRERIGDLVDKMNESQLYEYATFILELRAGKKQYGLDILTNGAKMILGL